VRCGRYGDGVLCGDHRWQPLVSAIGLVGIVASTLTIYSYLFPGVPRAWRELSRWQAFVLEGSRSTHRVCELTIQFTSTTSTARYANQVGTALSKAGWPLLWSQFLNHQAERATDNQHPIAILAHPDDPVGAELRALLAEAEVAAVLIPSASHEVCKPELQIDDPGPTLG
jgi:hypothetical protein